MAFLAVRVQVPPRVHKQGESGSEQSRYRILREKKFITIRDNIIYYNMARFIALSLEKLMQVFFPVVICFMVLIVIVVIRGNGFNFFEILECF